MVDRKAFFFMAIDIERLFKDISLHKETKQTKKQKTLMVKNNTKIFDIIYNTTNLFLYVLYNTGCLYALYNTGCLWVLYNTGCF